METRSKADHPKSSGAASSAVATVLPLLIALGSGMLMGITPAPVNAWPLAWVALVPLWVLVLKQAKLHKLDLKQWRLGSIRSFPVALGLAWGIGYHGLALSWIVGVHPMTWMGVPWLASLAIALFCWVFITLWGAVMPATWAWGITLLSRRSSDTPHNPTQNPKSKIPAWCLVLGGAALWCGLEALWSISPLYWSSLSYTQSPYNLLILHLGQISGPLTVTAAIVLVNGFLAAAWISRSSSATDTRPTNFSRPQHFLAIALSLLVVCHLIGWGLYNRPLSTDPQAALKVGIIQGNVPNQIKLYPEGWRRAIEGYTSGYEALADQGVDAVLTPETALPFLWIGANRSASSFYQAIVERGVTAWVGAIGERGSSITNSLFTVAGQGEVISQYDKVKLVPLGEYIPFQGLLGGLINRLSPLDAHMVAGQPGQILDTPLGRAIVSICYESAFSDHFQAQAAAGGQFILSASNDAHYSAAMPAQHHAQDVMRAIETDRWAVRATNTGYSAIVDPRGQTRWLSQLNTYALHADTIYRRQTRPLYVRWGNWLTPALGMVTAIAWVFYGLRQRP